MTKRNLDFNSIGKNQKSNTGITPNHRQYLLRVKGIIDYPYEKNPLTRENGKRIMCSIKPIKPIYIIGITQGAIHMKTNTMNMTRCSPAIQML